MAIKFTHQQKNAMKRIDRAIETGQAYRYEKEGDRAIFREYLAALKDRDLFEGDELYPHDLPRRVMEAAIRLSDPQMRLDTVAAILATSHPPRPSIGKDAMLGAALAYRAVNVIPLLVQHGFKLTQKEINTYGPDMGSLIAQGKWPHLELIAPNALFRAGSDIMMELLRIPGKQEDAVRIPIIEAVNEIARLEAPDHFCDEVSEVVAGFAGRRKKDNIDPDNEDLVLAMKRLIERGWLDIPYAIGEAQNTRHEVEFGAFMAKVEQSILHSSTPSAPRHRANPRL